MLYTCVIPENTVYGRVHEEILADIPEPLGQRVVLFHYILHMAGLLQAFYILLIKHQFIG